MTSHYLSYIKIKSFGALANRVVGPFSPHLNVVFGENEAGKTTLSSFVGGVLFGWEDARGSKNTYKPENAERAGSLFFAERPACEADGDEIAAGEKVASSSLCERDESDRGESCGLAADVSRETSACVQVATGSGEAPTAVPSGQEGDAPAPPAHDVEQLVELSRARNADGLVGEASIVADLDRQTFRTMFSLTSDELRSLRNTTDVTAKLLTAGSGTGSSPAHALSHVQEQIATFTSRAAGAEHSLVNLGRERDELLAEIAAAEAETERFKREDREFRELMPQRDDVLARLESLNEEIETLSACRAKLEKLDGEIAGLEEQVEERRSEEASLRAEFRMREREWGETFPRLTASEERKLRDQLDALTVEETKCEHAVDLAQDDYTTSKAAHDALVEAVDVPDAASALRQRSTQILLSVAIPLMFMASGVPLFMHGREITSLSFTALGIGLVIIAIMMACAALVMLFRPNKEEEAREARKQDARWVMLQDQKKLEACQEARERFRARVDQQLAAEGLGESHGSIRRAKALLDSAKEARAETAAFQQRRQAIVSRRTSIEESLASARAARVQACRQAGLDETGTVGDVEASITRKTRQRAGLLEASENLNRRYGELKQELSQAVDQRRFDELKLRYHEVLTRFDESAHNLARLLLARRMLEASIAAWEGKSQPAVYRQASRLLGMMTNGRWMKVSMSSDGVLYVADSVHTTRDPLHLSLGTRQQLYLALRIALLMTADNVGRSIPILADDILVNFDAARRVGAARALAELARMRQVILFTCHEEVVDALRAVDPGLNEIEL